MAGKHTDWNPVPVDPDERAEIRLVLFMIIMAATVAFWFWRTHGCAHL